MGAQRVVLGLRDNGEEFPIDASISHVDVQDAEYYTVILRDITERVRAEEALRKSREELHEMTLVGATAREQEKRRIARELHDELAQALTALKMDLRWLKESEAAASPAVAAKLAAMEQLLDGSVASTRRIAADLRPLMLDDLGLVPAAEWLADTFTRRHGVECRLAVEPPDLDLEDPQSTAVYRILQESLANVAKHAQASRVEVRLTRANGRVTLHVRDDGRGFNPGGPRKESSFGIVGLRERVHLVAGTLRIESSPGNGTAVEVSIPMPPGA
jgi:signal transduction histidine kinase